MLPLSTVRKCTAIFLGLSLLPLGGCEKSETSTQPAETPAPAPSPIPKPASPNSFAEVTAQLDPGGDFYAYLSTAQWLGKLSHGIDNLRDVLLSGTAGQPVADQQQAQKVFALLKDVVQKSGLEQITGLGASSFEISPGLHRNKLFLHHYPGQDTGLLWKLYGPSFEPPSSGQNGGMMPFPADKGLDLLPIDTALATYGDFDLAQLINFLRQEADQSGIPELKQGVAQWQTQFAGVTGLQLDDVLGSLNRSMGMVLTLDATSTISVPAGQQPLAIPAPRVALLIAVHNDLIFNQVDKTLAGNPGVLKVDEPGLKMRTMPLPMIPGLNLRPTVASWGDFLAIASDDKLIRDMIAVQKGAPGCKSTPEYATLSAGLPTQGNGFGIVTQRFVDTIRTLQSQTLVNQHGTNNAAQAALIKRMFSGNYSKPGHVMVIYSLLPDGWLSVGQGSQGPGQLLAPLAILPATLGAGAVIPALAGIHTRYQSTATLPTATPPSPPPTPAPTP
jgi:hypothetical protein